MVDEIYSELISAVHITGNFVRMDLMTLQPHLKGEEGAPVYELSARLILPIDAFVQGFGMQENVIKQLIASGQVTVVTQEGSVLMKAESADK